MITALGGYHILDLTTMGAISAEAPLEVSSDVIANVSTAYEIASSKPILIHGLWIREGDVTEQIDDFFSAEDIKLATTDIAESITLRFIRMGSDYQSAKTYVVTFDMTNHTASLAINTISGGGSGGSGITEYDVSAIYGTEVGGGKAITETQFNELAELFESGKPFMLTGFGSQSTLPETSTLRNNIVIEPQTVVRQQGESIVSYLGNGFINSREQVQIAIEHFGDAYYIGYNKNTLIIRNGNTSAFIHDDYNEELGASTNMEVAFTAADTSKPVMDVDSEDESNYMTGFFGTAVDADSAMVAWLLYNLDVIITDAKFDTEVSSSDTVYGMLHLQGVFSKERINYEGDTWFNIMALAEFEYQGATYLKEYKVRLRGVEDTLHGQHMLMDVERAW